MTNSVNSPGTVSMRKVPWCPCTMMSWLNDNPSPVPCPGGLAAKTGSKILSALSAGMPGPMRIATSAAGTEPHASHVAVAWISLSHTEWR